MVNYSMTMQPKIYNVGIDNILNKWCWENCTAACKIIKLELFLMPKQKFIMGQRLNFRLGTIKLLDET